MKTIQYHGTKLAYQEAGDPEQPTIIFLHGNSSNSHFFNAQFQSSLTDKYHLIAPDFLGHGASGFIDEVRFVKPLGLAESVQALIEKLQIQEVLLYGISLGGHVAIECISLLGDKLKGIMISGAPPLKLPLNMEEAFLPVEAFGALMQEEMAEDAQQLWLNTSVHQSEQVRTVVKAGLNSTNGKFRPLFFSGLQTENGLIDEKKLIETFKGHVAILHGKSDPFLSMPYLKSLKIKILYRQEIIIIDDSAHYPSTENPIRFNKILSDFASATFK